MSENKSYMENKEAAASGFSQDATHYQLLEQQPIEIMQRLMSKEQFYGFCWGTIIAYVLRCGHKDEPKREMQKIAQYAMWAVEAEEGKMIDPRRPIESVWAMSDADFNKLIRQVEVARSTMVGE